jgi:hypothetical protein
MPPVLGEGRGGGERRVHRALCPPPSQPSPRGGRSHAGATHEQRYSSARLDPRRRADRLVRQAARRRRLSFSPHAARAAGLVGPVDAERPGQLQALARRHDAPLRRGPGVELRDSRHAGRGRRAVRLHRAQLRPRGPLLPGVRHAAGGRARVPPFGARRLGGLVLAVRQCAAAGHSPRRCARPVRRPGAGRGPRGLPHGQRGSDDILSILGPTAAGESAQQRLGWPELPLCFDPFGSTSYWWTNQADGSPLRTAAHGGGLNTPLFSKLFSQGHVPWA